MIRNKLIYLSCSLLLLKFIQCSPANIISPDCSDKVYSEFGIKKSDDFCATVDAYVYISNETSKSKYELRISRFSIFWIAIELEDMKQILINHNTPTFIRDINVSDDESITHCRTKEGVDPMGTFTFLQNLEKKTAVVLFDNEIVEGQVNNTHLRYVRSIKKYVLIMENKYVDYMKHLIGQNHCVNNARYTSHKFNIDSPMYYKVLVPLDFSFVKGKTYSEVLKTLLIFWNEVDMHFRRSFLRLEISLNIVGVIMPHENFSYLTTTADNLYSTIDPIAVGTFFRWNSPVYHKFFDTIFTMTALPLCDKWSDDNHCQQLTSGITNFYKNFTDSCDPLSVRLSKYPKDYGAVIRYQKGISHAEEVAKGLKEAFELNDDECSRKNSNFLKEKYYELGNFPQTLTGVEIWSYSPGKICSTWMDLNKFGID